MDDIDHGEPDGPVFVSDFLTEFRPMKARWRFRHVASGDIIEVDALVVQTEDWESRPEAGNPEWRPVDFGALLVALRAVC